MATISLYKNKINDVGGLIDSIVKSSNKLDTQLGTLRNTLQGVDSSTCNLQDVVSSISSSSKSEQEKVADLKRLNSKLTDFITMTSRRDAAVKTAVERSKTDFYSKYSYLKPECEKNVFEHICDGLQTAGEWCKEHWKLIVTVVIVVVAVVLLCTGVGSGLGAVLLAGACWGAIMGACIGGVAGGIGSMMNGGSFLSGFEDGAFSGAIGGAIGGAVSAGLGAAIGPALTFTGSIVRGAAIGAASSGVSNMGVSTINYLIENKTLEGSGNVIISSGISGIISGGITGGIMGALTFQSPSSTAQSWQGSDDYPGIDNYKDITVRKGTVLYRGEPNGSEYFTTLDAVEGSGRNAQTLFEGLQVKPHDVYGYRGEVSGYMFTKNVTGGYGITSANPQYGSGGLPQIFIPNIKKLIEKGILIKVDTIPLIK
ncbi:MAG: hypothetical protein UCN61_08480 [Ruminococcus sp.]|nr:hypothetical protein [Ruminococcus sp.]